MQHDPISSDLNSDLRSNFELDLLRSNGVSFDPSRREEHSGENYFSRPNKSKASEENTFVFVLKIGS